MSQYIDVVGVERVRGVGQVVGHNDVLRSGQCSATMSSCSSLGDQREAIRCGCDRTAAVTNGSDLLRRGSDCNSSLTMATSWTTIGSHQDKPCTMESRWERTRTSRHLPFDSPSPSRSPPRFETLVQAGSNSDPVWLKWPVNRKYKGSSELLAGKLQIHRIPESEPLWTLRPLTTPTLEAGRLGQQRVPA